jgi:beta-lactamase class A
MGLGLALASGAAVPAAALAAGAPATPVPDLLAKFLALPGNKSARIDLGEGPQAWRAGHAEDAALFCGSAFKTFVLAAYLREVEAGRLSLDEQLAIDDRARCIGGNVFENLTGTVPARIVLEAMIAHSDNTATDVAMRRLGADKVRSFIADAGLAGVRIPDSTRAFFSYIAGYPAGEDMGVEGIMRMAAGKPGPTPPRQALNGDQSMLCPAATFVAYYRRALAGAYFAKPETLVEFKRIHAMADAIAHVVPPETPAYAKGGSIDWNGFHCMATAGQMMVGGSPVTFCLNLNWSDSEGEPASVIQAYTRAVAEVLARARASMLAGRC